MKKDYKSFQIRWNEPLGKADCPYMRRWVFVFFGFAIRLHKWHRSDDKRYKHNHPWGFATIVLKGSYTDVSEKDGVEIRDILKTGSIRFRSKYHLHYVDVPPSGAISLLFTLPTSHNWAFWVNGKWRRPLRFFGLYGHPPCHEQ